MTRRDWGFAIGAPALVIVFGIALACTTTAPPGDGDPAAETELSPGGINFGFVDVGGSVTEDIEASVDPLEADFPHAYELTMQYDIAEIFFVGGAVILQDTLTEAEPAATHPVFFAPQEPGVFVATVTADVAAGGDPAISHLVGWGVESCLFSRNEIDFGDVASGYSATDTFVIRNTSAHPHEQEVTVSLSMPDCDGLVFLVGANEVNDVMEWTLAAGETAICTLKFAPASPGELLCTFETDAASYCGPLVVRGVGVTPPDTDWIACESGTSSNLRAIHGAPGGDLMAVGDDETVLEALAATPCVWSAGPAPDLQSGTASLASVWGLGGDETWIAANAASGRAILQRNGDVWQIADLNSLIERYDCGWGSSEEDIYFAGNAFSSDMANARHFDGDAWSDLILDFGMSEITGIAGSGPNDVWAVLGQPSYNLWHFDGGDWENRSDPVVDTILRDVWVSASGQVFAVGPGGAIYHHDGVGWTDLTLPGDPPDLFAVWGRSASEVRAVGSEAAIYLYDGSSWTLEHPPPGVTATLRDVWMDATGATWAVGDGGVILHRP